MPGKNGNKTLYIIGAIIAAGVIAYFLFFYKKSAYQIASDLGLYTGNTGDDQTLDTLINQILSGGGAIAATNLEWELNDAAVRYRNGDVISRFCRSDRPPGFVRATWKQDHPEHSRG